MSKVIAKVDVMEEVGTKDWEIVFKAFLNEDGDIVGEDRAVEWRMVQDVEEAVADFDTTQTDVEDYTFTRPDEYDKRIWRSFVVTVTPLTATAGEKL